MTTAHRPTWNSAVASGSNPSGNLIVAQSTKVANRDAAGMTKIKYREVSQGAPEERLSRKEFREELEKKEKRARDERDGRVSDGKAEGMKFDSLTDGMRRGEVRHAVEDNPFPEDADDDVASGSEARSDGDDDDEEDTEELMRELAKIKKEREMEEQKLKDEQNKVDERSRRDEIMKGNPLTAGDYSLKRRWDDDTVFKNQARTAPKLKQRYINDAVRSDFHKKFLNKYIWVDGTAH
mmetsp:Transcript_39923/g.87140  ORF Transcript_39923/g.87140 Transcript_39923/m.87140 type:complete len:237 (+) Transcript_39923:65-775(+)